MPAPRHFGRAGGALVRHDSTIAVLGEASRREAWELGATHTAFAMMAGIDLDLREASSPSARRSSTPTPFWAGIDIIVNEFTHVIVDGIGIMGGFDRPRQGVAGPRPRLPDRAGQGGGADGRRHGPAQADARPAAPPLPAPAALSAGPAHPLDVDQRDGLGRRRGIQARVASELPHTSRPSVGPAPVAARTCSCAAATRGPPSEAGTTPPGRGRGRGPSPRGCARTRRAARGPAAPRRGQRRRRRAASRSGPRTPGGPRGRSAAGSGTCW